ncbi:two-component system sensor histidine kinase CreC [Thiobacillus sp.]|uniref:two-component system sensor histidine kinase CreC n=1 Tax=Thiobacillus sp. TaxID=924 RepID=UPI0025CEB724|nr:two-component system sensor histidine kinase CreC [Thiobacillus sp.]MBT9538475.1 two-component system sensor histidine kinase CreC [Thiobacillus sp.]
MNFFVRYFVGYVVVTALAVLLAMKLFTDQLVPGVRQSVEETLVQTANLMAEMAAGEMAHVQGKATSVEGIEAMFRAYEKRRFDARIYGVLKSEPDLRVYVTDAAGRVVFDSTGRDVGKDYSRWIDVSRTLKGEYGARTTRENEYDGTSSVMYVAAPILREGRIVGVLSVGKPSRSFQGFIDLTVAKAWQSAWWLFGLAMLLALGFSYWMTRDLRRLVGHADEVADGRRARIPVEGRGELRRLAQALEHLRAELDGKAHVEKVSQLLAHELKSPIAAIRGAVELLPDETDAGRRARLEANIAAESERLQRIVEGVLNLARVENRDRLDEVERIAFDALVADVLDTRAARLAARELRLDIQLAPAEVSGNRFLLRQAVANLIDNAIDFSPAGGTLTVELETADGSARLRIRDRGPGIPDYARPRLFERFYSTPRPDSGERSSGLGLNLVREAARLHGGDIVLDNHPDGGAEARLDLPSAKDT